MGGPIVVVEYDPDWVRQYEAERTLILQIIGEHVAAIEHMGSTAVPGLAAKPIIDILLGVRALGEAPACIQPLANIGYEYVPEYETSIPERRYFHKGPPQARTHHLHMVEVTSEFWKRQLAFRDYLRAHPAVAREYAELKQALAVQYKWDRSGYTDAKSAFVQAVLAKALARGNVC